MASSDPAPSERRSLSVGDAITVIALLAFAIGWVVLWAHFIAGDHSGEKMSNGFALLLFVIIFCPPFWAGVLIEKVIDRG